MGTIKRIEKGRPEPFYSALQHYVDSQEKATGDPNKTKERSGKEQMEFWPLVKVPGIYTKADALSMGAVIVDLPGVHDSNAARANVATSYMKQTTGLWVVAPVSLFNQRFPTLPFEACSRITTNDELSIAHFSISFW